MCGICEYRETAEKSQKRRSHEGGDVLWDLISLKFSHLSDQGGHCPSAKSAEDIIHADLGPLVVELGEWVTVLGHCQQRIVQAQVQIKQ